MDAAQIAAMIADRKAGTPGPWITTERRSGFIEEIGPCRVEEYAGAAWVDVTYTDARRIARVPDMEAHIIAQAAELERLRYVLGGVKSAIDSGRNEPLQIWRDQIEIAISAQGALKGGTQ